MDACLDAHFSSITCIDYIKNGSVYDRLLSGSRDKVLIIWDLNTFTKQRTIPIYESIESFLLLNSSYLSRSSSEELSIESRYLITMGNEGVLKLWDIKTGHSLFKQSESDSLKILNKRLSKEYADLELVIVQAIFNKATNTIILVTADQLIVFVRLNVGLIEAKLVKSAEKLDQADSLFETYKQYIGDHGEILDTQMCNASENLLAMATNNEFLKIYNLDNWDCKLLKGHTDLIICLAACVDKKNPKLSYLASSSKDTTIRLWRIEEVEESEGQDEVRGVGYKYACVSVCNGHTQDVGALCFSKLGVEFLVSGSIDTTIKLWKLNANNKDKELSMSVLFTSKAHEKDINSVCVSANDKLIASGSTDKTAKVSF